MRGAGKRRREGKKGKETNITPEAMNKQKESCTDRCVAVSRAIISQFKVTGIHAYNSLLFDV